MAIKKSELYSTLWASCNKLRGGMDASQYKDYVLILLFVRYVSDKYAAGNDSFIRIPAGGSFADMVALKGSADIGKGINDIISRLAQANDLTGIITQADFNDHEKLGRGKEMQDKLSGLVSIFQNPDLDFSSNNAGGDDILGDAYEYLMRHFAAESGKSKGQFYTPAEVSRVIAGILDIGNLDPLRSYSAYDPTCGSGSLLLKVAHHASAPVALFGQEKETTTAGLARMNMILHNAPQASIAKGQSTLSDPMFLEDSKLKTFDFAVSNPPFSSKNWTDGFNPENDIFQRFGFGIPPAKNGDYAFLLHIIASLKDNGKAAVILPLGVLFRTHAEADIRKKLLTKGLISGIIGLPVNLFYGTAIPACIICIDKTPVPQRDIFIIDASGGFVKDGNKNRLREQDIRKITDVFNARKDVPGFARMVSFSEISRQDFNLNISRYIDSQPPADVHDLKGHLSGGIPQSDIARIPLLQACPQLFEELFTLHEPGYLSLRAATPELPDIIRQHPQLMAFAALLDKSFDLWQQKTESILMQTPLNPKNSIHEIGDSLFFFFRDLMIPDPYELFQALMTYWNNTLQDDLYIIRDEGWNVVSQTVSSKGRDVTGRLIPADIIAGLFCPQAAQTLAALVREKEALAAQIAAIRDELPEETELFNEKGKIIRSALSERISELAPEQNKTPRMAAEPAEDYGEYKTLLNIADLASRLERLSAKIKTAASDLDSLLLKAYQDLPPQQAAHILFHHKWMSELRKEFHKTLKVMAGNVASRLTLLHERYHEPLPLLISRVNESQNHFSEIIKKLGMQWP